MSELVQIYVSLTFQVYPIGNAFVQPLQEMTQTRHLPRAGSRPSVIAL